MRARSLILVVLFTIPLSSFAQNFKKQFDSVYTKPDTLATLKVLNNWQNSNPNDPEMYVAYFNFYANRSMTEIVNLQTTQTSNNSFALTDPKTKKVVGYLNDGETINLTLLSKGFKYIDTAIEKFPSRLDMRFGEIYMLGKIPDYNLFTTKLDNAIDYGNKIQSHWLWTNNKLLDDPEKFVLNAEQDYIGQIYDAGDAQINNMRLIAQTVLKYYPDNVENLSNLAITYMLIKDYMKALEPLLKAYNTRPNDYVVIGNIAYCYKGLNDKSNAVKYYKLNEKYGDADAKEYAKKQLEELAK